jgi:hypothetical protein
MQSRLIRIGLKGKVDGNRFVICASSHPRAGWEDAFEAMVRRGDDALLDGDELPPTQWDEGRWEWP